MNKPPVIRPPGNRGYASRVGLFIGLFFVVGTFYVVANVISFFRLNSDERVLRDVVLKSAPASALRMEFAMGTWTLGLARFGTSFLDLPVEARSALESVRAVEAGIYKFEAGGFKGDRAALFNRADTAMSSRGWERVVGVMQNDQSVAVYMPSGAKMKTLKVCVLVVTREEMVIAGATARPEPLIALAVRQGRLAGARQGNFASLAAPLVPGTE